MTMALGFGGLGDAERSLKTHVREAREAARSLSESAERIADALRGDPPSGTLMWAEAKIWEIEEEARRLKEALKQVDWHLDREQR